MDWRLIDTAPDDGSWFIASDGPGGEVYPAHGREWPGIKPRHIGIGWCHASGRMKFPLLWMPLPDGPEGK